MDRTTTKRLPFYFLLLLLITFMACNNYTEISKEQTVQSVLVRDTLLSATGDATLDSLLLLAATAPFDTTLAKLYNDIGDIYQGLDFDKAQEYYIRLNEISEQLNWNEGKFLYAASMSNILNREGQCDSALVILEYAQELAKHIQDEEWLTHIIFNIGNIYFGKEWYETALSYYMEVLPFYEKKDNKPKLAMLYYMMSQVYFCVNSAEAAIEYGEKSVALNSEDESALCALAMAYSLVQQYNKANSYFDKSLDICKSTNNLYLMGIIYCYLANNALFSFDLDKAESYAQKALVINQQFGYPSCCDEFILLGRLEQMKSNYSQSEFYVKEALEIANARDALVEKKQCYLLLSELAVAQNNYKKNIEYWRKYNMTEMAIAYQTTLRSAEEMLAKYETAKKEIEIERQQQIIDRQDMQHTFLLLGILICFLLLMLLIFMLRIRRIRNRSLVEMNATKDRFFNIISHDLKNPAIVQRNAIRILYGKCSQWDTATLKNYCGELLASADMQVEFLNRLLCWAQLQSSHITYQPVSFDLEQGIAPDIALVRRMANDKNVQLITDIPHNTIVIADVSMIATIIRNLLSNAVKFTEQGGYVSLNVSASQKGKCTISISDTGVGMSASELAQISCLNHYHTRMGTSGETGTGMGLHVCCEMLKQHGAVLQIESELGKGSRFWFEINTL
ncbi:MAG: tetratricopeptide repeat protein [Bacteroidetes bacterium]|nr:tetratricopeptide repeat protein [Bacteroidota bacterium]MCL1968886.1 tetratricopeptide repeat protein [Bacteroidota bacterium]MCL1969001.1 tetratricopeptide repeat protein [Bacteroidota bacterium]